MKQIELTKEQVTYLATYIEEEFVRDDYSGTPSKVITVVRKVLEDGIEAYNGGAR